MNEYRLMRIAKVDRSTPSIYLFCRDTNGELKVFEEKFTPYFYVDYETAKSVVEDESYKLVPAIKNIDLSKTYDAYDGKKVVRVDINVTGRLSDVMDSVREFFVNRGGKTYESHILLTKRYLVDKKLYRNFVLDGNVIIPCKGKYVKPRILYVDIECYNPKLEKIDKPKFPIVSIALYDNYKGEIVVSAWHPSYTTQTVEIKNVNIKHKDGEDSFKVTIIKYSNEKDVIKFFTKYVDANKPDILAGWFAYGYFDVYAGMFIKGFDFPYIIERAKEIGLEIDELSPFRYVSVEGGKAFIKGLELFDLQFGLQTIQRMSFDLESWALDYVANVYLGLPLKDNSYVFRDWQDNPESLIKRNVMDVIRCVLLDNKLKIIEHFDWRSEIVGCPISDTMSDLQMINMLLLRNADKVIPDENGGTSIEKVKGAYVKEPIPGRYFNVANFDFKMAYPTCIANLNISPDTLADNGKRNVECVVIENGTEKSLVASYVDHPIGVLPRIVNSLMSARLETRNKLKNREYKDEEEKALLYMKDRCFKAVINGVYGVTGNPKFMLYNPIVTASTTAVVRDVIIACEKFLESKGYKVLYCDTDGIYAITNSVDESKNVEKMLNEFVKNYMKEKWDAESFQIEFSTFFSSILFKKKKKDGAGAKKNLVGISVWENGAECRNLVTIGTAMRLSSYPKLTAKMQKDVINMILNNERKEAIIDYLRNLISDCINGKYSIDEIGIPRAIHKTTRNNPPLRGILYSINTFGHPPVRYGEKVKYIYTLGVLDYPPTDCVAFTDSSYIPKDKIMIDWGKMIERIIKSPIEDYIESVGISWSDVSPFFKGSVGREIRKLSRYQKILGGKI